jgi:hypothetical protein
VSGHEVNAEKVEETQPAPKTVPSFVWTIPFTIVFLAAAVALAYWGFGSIGSALNYLSGERLIVDSAAKSLGTVKKGERVELLFGLKNYTKSPVIILGALSSCSCALVEDTPLTIPPGETRHLKVVVSTASATTAKFAQTIKIFTDFPRKPIINLAVTGSILLGDVKH